MDTESLYVMSGVCGMLVVGIVIVSYFLLENRREKNARELENLRVEKRVKANMLAQEFSKKAHLINPVTFTNGITVSFERKYTHVSIYEETVRFGIEYKIRDKFYYDVISINGMLSHIIQIDDKYSLEDLEGHDWIIETAYNFTEDRINKIKKERNEKESFIKNINNNELILKNN